MTEKFVEYGGSDEVRHICIEQNGEFVRRCDTDELAESVVGVTADELATMMSSSDYTFCPECTRFMTGVVV